MQFFDSVGKNILGELADKIPEPKQFITRKEKGGYTLFFYNELNTYFFDNLSFKFLKEIEPNFKIDNLRYEKIIICSDADVDGLHIACLLILLFGVLTPEIIKRGHLYYAHMPLRAINDRKKNIFIPLWTEEEHKKAFDLKQPITYYKGLGEMNSSDIEICIIDNKTRRLTQIKYSQNFEKLLNLFISVDEKRKLLVGDWRIDG